VASSQPNLGMMGPNQHRPHTGLLLHNPQQPSSEFPTGPATQCTTVDRGSWRVAERSLEAQGSSQPSSTEGTHGPSAVRPPEMGLGQSASDGPEREKRVRRVPSHLQDYVCFSAQPQDPSPSSSALHSPS